MVPERSRARDGGGFGFSVELFFFFLTQLLSLAELRDTHSPFYIGMFRAIASNWRQHVGTQCVVILT